MPDAPYIVQSDKSKNGLISALFFTSTKFGIHINTTITRLLLGGSTFVAPPGGGGGDFHVPIHDGYICSIKTTTVWVLI